MTVRNLTVQVDELIQNAEREYSSAELPLEPTKAEMMLREHEASRSKVKSLLDGTADKGEEIVVRVRQQVRALFLSLSPFPLPLPPVSLISWVV